MFRRRQSIHSTNIHGYDWEAKIPKIFSNIVNHVLKFFSVGAECPRTVLVHADRKRKIETRETNILTLIILRPAKKEMKAYQKSFANRKQLLGLIVIDR